jgi:hypothetical protein
MGRWQVAIGTSLILWAGVAGAQSPDTFKGRLSAVPVNAATAPSTLGSGSVTAVLQGSTLIVKGAFLDLSSPATAARLHRALPGMRGPSIGDVRAQPAASGTIEGSLALSQTDVDLLKRGWLYVQVYTEKNPDGHLRGWLSR